MNTMATPHLWQGEWLTNEQLSQRIERIDDDVRKALATPFDVRALLNACEKLSKELNLRSSTIYGSLESILQNGFQMQEEERSKELAELATFLSREDLERKLACELGMYDPFNFTRQDHRDDNFEKWAPLGFLVHVAPTNAFSAGAWSVLEGLLSSNVNFLKTGGSDEIFAQVFLKHLIDQDTTGTLAPRIFACRISSRERAALSKILNRADGVIVWGDEGAIAGIKELTPIHARFIEWGPKISFAYFANDSLDDEQSLLGLAFECCRMEQQACSSPQIVYVETENRGELTEFATRLAKVLAKTSDAIPIKEPGPQEQAEITSVVELCRLESCLGLTELIEDPNGAWRILVEHSSVVKASPLYRTIWVKPLLRNDISATLSPFRFFLQTAGVACKRTSLAEIADAFTQAGVLRVTRCGGMLDSYSGEPHDGVYALQRYSRRVSLQTNAAELPSGAGRTPAVPELEAGKMPALPDSDAQMGARSSSPLRNATSDLLQGISSFAELRCKQPSPPTRPIMSKEDFQSSKVSAKHSELFFKSGGSSGDPKLSIFTYDDYHLQMRAAAYGLYAAGLDLETDRCMNLFFAGGLYGGFVSFFTILETLKAVQYPMAGIADLEQVANTIVSQKCNTLLGMPSYLIQLFTKHSDLFSKHKVVKKIFYAGEHFNQKQRDFFHTNFEVELIRSCGYGSVDAGPIGYQCPECTGAIHHLYNTLHILEIVAFDGDTPVSPGEAGRVILTSLQRSGQEITRYDIGDTARLLSEPCPCGRSAPRFELLGRHGDVFKIGSAFFNYAKFTQILSDDLNYAGEVQLHLKANGSLEEISVCLANSDSISEARVLAKLLESYDDLRHIVETEKLLHLSVSFVDVNDFERAPGSGKLRHIVDKRTHH